MFSRPPKATDPADTGGRQVAVASLVAEGVRIQGDLETVGDLHLDGLVVGDLRAGVLVIGETGAVSGSIHADAVEIRGRVTGVICSRRVKLWPTARVDGDISHTELAIEGGAHFEGRSLALVAPETPALSVVAAE